MEPNPKLERALETSPPGKIAFLLPRVQGWIVLGAERESRRWMPWLRSINKNGFNLRDSAQAAPKQDPPQAGRTEACHCHGRGSQG
jgi:hypothetical protein